MLDEYRPGGEQPHCVHSCFQSLRSSGTCRVKNVPHRVNLEEKSSKLVPFLRFLSVTLSFVHSLSHHVNIEG